MRPSLIIGTTIVGLAIVGGAGYAGYRTMQVDAAPPPEAPETIPVQRGDVKLTVTAPGQLEGIRSQTLRAPAATTVLEMAVWPGDRVRKNDIVARLDSEPLEKALEQAQDAVADDRESIEAGVSAAEEKLRKAQDDLRELQLSYPSEERARLQLKQEQDALSKAKTANNEAKSAYNDARKIRDARKADLKDVNKAAANAQDAYDQTLDDLADSQAARASAQQDLVSAQADQAAAQDAYDQAVADGDPPDVIDGLYAALQAANQAVGDAQAALDAADAAVGSAQQAVNTAHAALLDAQSGQVSAQSDYDDAEADFQSASSAYELTKTALKNADYAVRFAQIALDDLASKQKAADVQIESARRAIERARDDLDEARARTADSGLVDAVEEAQIALANATIHAPFDGIVQSVSRQAGDKVSEDEALAVVLDPAVLEVSATVVEEDLPLVAEGQQVDLFFDAAPDAELTGVVDRIVPERVKGSDRPVYTVYIRIDDALPEGLLPGMTVDGSIIIEQSTGVLILPRALVRAGSGGTAVVEVWDGQQRQERTVTVGLRGDVNVEIVEGLSEGERVVSE